MNFRGRHVRVAGGDILIKFHDGAVYDGPYVLETCLSVKGSVPPGEKALYVVRRHSQPFILPLALGLCLT